MEYLEHLSLSGFDFKHFERNQELISKGVNPPTFKKTGTTIVGVMFSGGVVIAADTRATGGTTVLDKNCEKLHYLAPNMYCAGAGTAADTEHVTLAVQHQLELLRLYTKRQNRVASAVTMLNDKLFPYMGYIGAYLILGGVDCTGPSLYMISADGNFRHLPYATMGSGSLAAMSVFESEYKDDMTRDEAIDMCIRAIEGGIFNDLGSGSNVDVVIIEQEGVEYRRNTRSYNQRPTRPAYSYDFPKGVTPVKNTYPIVVENVAMELE